MKYFGSLTVFTLSVCLFFSDALAQQQIMNFHLPPESEVSRNYYLFDQDGDVFAGIIAVTLSQRHQDGKHHLRMHLSLPDGLERGFDWICLFDVSAISPTNGILREINRAKDVRFSQHRNAPRQVRRFYDVVDRGRRFLLLNEHFEHHFAEINENKDFVADFIINDPTVKAPFQFDLELRIYYFERGFFKGAFHPLMVRIYLESEIEEYLMAQDSVLDNQDTDTEAAQEKIVKQTDTLADQDMLPTRDEPYLRETTVERPATRQEPRPQTPAQPRVQAQMPSRVETTPQNEAHNTLNHLLEEVAAIYNAIFAIYTGKYEVDVSAVYDHEARLERVNREFERVIRETDMDQVMRVNIGNEFQDYKESSLSMIADLLGDDIASDRRRRSDLESSGRNRSFTVLIMVFSVIALIGGVFLLMRWQKKLQKARIQKKIQSRANKELHRQKFEMRKQKRSLKI